MRATPRPARRVRPPRIATVGYLVVPLVVLLMTWAPELGRFRVPDPVVDAATVDAARLAPADAVLDELRQFSLLPIEGRSRDMEVELAEQLLAGRLALPGLPEAAITLPFSADDLDGLPPALRLWFAGFIVPDVLLAAYVDTGREAFFSATRDVIAAWDRYERRSPRPRGLLWNDHAVASRVHVLAAYWGIARSRPDYDSAAGRAVLEQAERYAYLLASPEYFTFSTNHGVMQNLGLLELSLAFPSRPRSAEDHRIALERLGGQLAFLVDEHGVMRENSAWYQAFDLNLLGMVFRCMTLLGDHVPTDWSARYRDGTAFLASLQRPDGTLPMTGDTDGAAWLGFPRVTTINASGESAPLQPFAAGRPSGADRLEVAAGYWIHWDGLADWPAGDAMSQTVVTWTRPPGPAHKHADELSVQIWSGGQAWLTAMGYWPFDDPGRGQAESWDGANAPHVAGEAATSQRVTTVRASGSGDGLAAIDVERDGPGSYVARRQVVHVSPDVWLILDTVEGAGDSGSRTVWSLPSQVDVSPGAGAGSFRLEAPTSGAVARMDLVGSPGTTVDTYRGSRTPLAGWQVVEGVPRPATAIAVGQPGATAWLVTVVSGGRAGTPPGLLVDRPQVVRLDAGDDWEITLPTAGSRLSVRRAGDALEVTGADGLSVAALSLTRPPADEGNATARAAYEAMARAYPVFRSLSSRRVNVSILVLALAFAAELVLLVVQHRLPAAYPALRVAWVIGWVGFAGWLWFVFLQPWEIASL